MAERVTMMKLKVDLQCHKCSKKVKNVLAKFPQIRDQVYDEKQNIVTIKVVCCNPEKIRDKIYCKGSCAIISIEIEISASIKPTPMPPPTILVCLPPPLVIPVYLPAIPPVGFCCDSCSHGQPGGPCVNGGTSRSDSCGGGRLCCVSHCDEYYVDQGPSGCSVM